MVVGAGARLVVVPNYDPPTPRLILHRLHATLIPFRAVENRVPFVRADTNGLSQIVAATGRIVGQSPLPASDVLVRDVPLGDGNGTIFTRLGDWLVYVCLLVLALNGADMTRRSCSARASVQQAKEMEVNQAPIR